MLLTGTTAERLEVQNRARVREIDRVVVKGKAAEAAIFDVIDDPAGARRTAWMPAYQAYQAGRFEEAERLFAVCLTTSPEDGPARLMIARSQELRAHPPPSWDGVTRFEHS